MCNYASDQRRCINDGQKVFCFYTIESYKIVQDVFVAICFQAAREQTRFFYKAMIISKKT